MASDLYRRMMAWHAAQGDAERAALAHRVWDGTPWMVNWYTGGVDHTARLLGVDAPAIDNNAVNFKRPA